MVWADLKRSIKFGIDVLTLTFTVFFVLMTGLDLVGASQVEGYSAQVVLASACGLSLLLTLRFLSTLFRWNL
jgi:hypothetical protein